MQFYHILTLRTRPTVYSEAVHTVQNILNVYQKAHLDHGICRVPETLLKKN